MKTKKTFTMEWVEYDSQGWPKHEMFLVMYKGKIYYASLYFQDNGYGKLYLWNDPDQEKPIMIIKDEDVELAYRFPAHMEDYIHQAECWETEI